MIIECIKEGFRITNKNWQVVLLQVIVLVINFVGFFLFIGIPIVLAIASLGMDIAYTKDILSGLFENPAELFSKYLGLAILIFTSFTFYLILASVLILYAFAGMLGVLSKAALNKEYKFSFHSFFEEAKRFFSPLLWLFSFAILIVIVIFIVFGVLAGILISFSETLPPVSLFITYFLGLLGIAIGFASAILSAYAAIVLVVEKGKVISAFKNALNFIKHKPFAFLFYIILIVGIIAVNIVLITLGISFSAVPVIGILAAVLFQIMINIVQSYLIVVMWGSLVVFYIKSMPQPLHPTAVVHTYNI